MRLATTLTAGAMLAAATLAMPDRAAAIEGTYSLQGQDLPPASTSYRGEVEVRQTGDTYQVAWTIGEQVFYGTGIRLGDSFGVVYDAPAAGSSGSAIYTIQPDGRLIGLWTVLGGDSIGTETWTPEGRL